MGKKEIEKEISRLHKQATVISRVAATNAAMARKSHCANAVASTKKSVVEVPTTDLTESYFRLVQQVL